MHDDSVRLADIRVQAAGKDLKESLGISEAFSLVEYRLVNHGIHPSVASYPTSQ
jgi:hypothetical protein